MRRAILVVVMVMLSTTVFAQTPAKPVPDVLISGGAAVSPVKESAAPVLAEVDALKIENALLKVQAAKAQLDALQAAFSTLMQALQRPGYVIAQGGDGKLIYQAEPAKPAPDPKK